MKLSRSLVSAHKTFGYEEVGADPLCSDHAIAKLVEGGVLSCDGVFVQVEAEAEVLGDLDG